jgi:2-phospho-L-lactate/phosphoenolpyruvate guanylyltransferase
MTLHIIIPCKSLTEGKSRLCPILGTGARQAICAGFLTSTLRVALSLAHHDQCHVVIGDAEAESLVRATGAAVIVDPRLGLNVALTTARDQICDESADDIAILILPIDLPRADKEALSAFICCKGDVVIAPDRRRSGTNALLIRGPALRNFEFCFGPKSFPRHHQVATAAGLRVVFHEDKYLAFDVDNPADYREWRRGERSSSRLQKRVRRPC